MGLESKSLAIIGKTQVKINNNGHSYVPFNLSRSKKRVYRLIIEEKNLLRHQMNNVICHYFAASCLVLSHDPSSASQMMI